MVKGTVVQKLDTRQSEILSVFPPTFPSEPAENASPLCINTKGFPNLSGIYIELITLSRHARKHIAAGSKRWSDGFQFILGDPGAVSVHLCPEMHTITKYRRQFDDFYNFGKYGDCGEFLSNHQMYVNQFHTWWPAMLANLVNTAILPNIYLMKCNTLL